MRRLLILLMLVAGCSDRPADPPAEEVSVGYTVRGVYLGSRYDGLAALVDHEAIPGLMPAMQMELRVADPALLAEVAPGDTIRFRFEDAGVGYWITEVEPLPPGTALDLAEVDSAGMELFPTE